MRGFVCLAIIVVAVLVGWAYKPNACKTYYKLDVAYETISREAPTIWHIANKYLASQQKYSDVREFVESIRESNAIAPNEYVFAGDTLIIPLYRRVEK